MSRGIRGRRRISSVETMAGWVFADLLLVLFVIGLGSQITALAKPETPTVEPSPPVSEPQSPPSMRLDPITVSIPTNPAQLLSSDPAQAGAAKQALVDAILEQTTAIDNERAAMVLVWGHARQTGLGIELAKAGVEATRVARPQTFDASVQKDLWFYDAEDGVIEFEIYLFQ